jgi:alpha-1,2-mannosyltransferase
MTSLTLDVRGHRFDRLTLVVAATGLLVGALVLAMVVRYASYTFAYDYQAYDQAARRVLAGGRLYDMSFTEAGPLGLFLYPPPAVLPFLPLALIPKAAAAAVWVLVDIVAFVAAVALLPVAPRTRATVLLLASVSWPVVFSIKVGQVGPVLLLAYAAGWRYLDRPVVVGAVAAFGAALKVQPIVVFGWMILSRRSRTFAIALTVLVAAAVVATFAVGGDAWLDFAAVITRVSDPIRTPSNFTPGATAYGLGASLEAARLVQLVSTIVVGAAVVVGSWSLRADASYLLAVVGSQLIPPLLWDHYALMLLLPVAWLLERRHWWAVLIPLSQSAVLVGITPPIAYDAAWFAALVGLLVVGRERQPGTLAAVGRRPILA